VGFAIFVSSKLYRSTNPTAKIAKQSSGSEVAPVRLDRSQNFAAVPRRARMYDSWTLVSINSRPESNTEEKEDQQHARRFCRTLITPRLSGIKACDKMRNGSKVCTAVRDD
jgi:hypothetical protein